MVIAPFRLKLHVCIAWILGSCYMYVYICKQLNELGRSILEGKKSEELRFFIEWNSYCNLHAKIGKLKVLTFRFWIYIPIKGEYSEYLRLTRCNGNYLQQDIKGIIESK